MTYINTVLSRYHQIVPAKSTSTNTSISSAVHILPSVTKLEGAPCKLHGGGSLQPQSGALRPGDSAEGAPQSSGPLTVRGAGAFDTPLHILSTQWTTTKCISTLSKMHLHTSFYIRFQPSFLANPKPAILVGQAPFRIAKLTGVVGLYVAVLEYIEWALIALFDPILTNSACCTAPLSIVCQQVDVTRLRL